MNSKINVVLIGMPGVGKSTIGVVLAKTLGMAFSDTDLIIQQTDGRLLQQIIQEDGVEGFLQIEQQVILQFCPRNTVVATGGSVVYSETAIQHLQRNGILVYLKLSYPEIEQRITNITTRGIALAPGQNLAGLFDERVRLYEKYADQTIDCSGRSVEETVAEIQQLLISS